METNKKKSTKVSARPVSAFSQRTGGAQITLVTFSL
jgi:hypothetical protein